jgi:hypothetical protein
MAIFRTAACLALLATAAQAQAAADPPWPGAKWPGKHATTRLDHAFPATLDGRKELQDAVIALAVYTSLAWQCRVKSVDWAANVQRHLDELAEDPGIHLNDTRPQAEVEAGLKNIIAHAGDGFADDGPDKKLAMCMLVPGAVELKEAAEIGRRKLLRHHDEWEGAGGD